MVNAWTRPKGSYGRLGAATQFPGIRGFEGELSFRRVRCVCLCPVRQRSDGLLLLTLLAMGLGQKMENSGREKWMELDDRLEFARAKR